MAKKIVRGITDVKTISNQDLDTNNVNDLLSDGEHSYIHRKKKDGSQEYHNLTNNIKTIEAEDNGLLSVRNYNNSTNSAKLTVHHDPQKEQKIYSTDHTIEIVHGDNGTGELTNVDTNPQKVLEHENLISDSEYITLQHQNGENVTHIKTAALKQELNNLHETKQDVLIAGDGITIQGQTISASGGGSVVEILENNQYLTAIQHVEICGNKTITTFSFEMSAFGMVNINNQLRTELLPFIPLNSKIISGGLELYKDNDTAVFIRNTQNGSENDRRHATFTFLTINESGGGGTVE